MASFFRTTIASVLAADLLAGCAYIQSALPAPAGASARGSTGPERVLLFIEGCRWLESTAGLVTDSNGPLYGFAAMGELHASNCGSGGCGTVFDLTPAGPGHSALLVGASGALYGTKTSGGGSSSSYDGTVFSVAP